MADLEVEPVAGSGPVIPDPADEVLFDEEVPGHARRSLAQTAGLTSGRAMAALLSFAFTAVIARTLDARHVGALSLGLSLAVALSVLPDLGLPMIVSDRVARHPEDTRSLVLHVVRIRLAVSVLAGLLLLVMYRLGTNATLAVPLFMAVSISASTVYSTATAALRGMGRVLPDSINEIASRTFVFAVGWSLLAAGHGIAAAACVLAAADVLSAVLLMAALWRRTKPGPAFPPGLVSWKAVVPLAVALLVSTLHTRIDVWLLAVIGNATDVAHYAIPAKVAEGLLLPAGVASVLVIPLTASVADPRARGRRALRYVLAVAGVVGAGGLVVAVWARTFLRLAFGSVYAKDGTVLRLLCLSDIPTAISVGLGPIVAILHRRALLRCVGAALAVNVVMNLALLPHYRGIGASWASVASMAVAATAMVVTVLRLPATGPTNGADADGDAGPTDPVAR